MPYCPDNYDAFDRYDADCERAERNWLARLPKCSWCGDPIRSDNCYIIGDDIVCEECIESTKDYTENHMRG